MPVKKGTKRTRTKREASSGSSAAALHGGLADNAQLTKISLIDKALRRIAKAANPWDESIEQRYRALLGGAGSVTEALSSNILAGADLADAISRRMNSITCEVSELDIGVKFDRMFELASPIEDCTIDLPTLRKRQATFKSHFPNYISSARFFFVPAPSNIDSVSVVPELITLCWGRNLRPTVDEQLQIERSAAALETTALPPANFRWLPQDSESSVDEAVASLFDARDTNEMLAKNLAQNAGATKWGKKSASRRRALLRLQILSMMPLGKTLKGGGAGKPIVQGAMADMLHALKIRCDAVCGPIHRDGVQQFWASEFKRLGLQEYALPLIKLH